MHYHQFLVSPELGGAGVIGLHLAQWTRDNGDRPCVWLPDMGRAAEAAAEAGLPWRRYGLTAMKQGFARHSIACMSLAIRLGRTPGLAHIHSPVIYRLIRPALRFARLRTVVHVHLEPDDEEMQWAFQEPPDLIVPCARFMTTAIRKAVGERGEYLRIMPVPNAVDTVRYFPCDKQAAKQKVGARLDRPLVLMLANLAPHKGQETAIRAVAELRRRGVCVECWLAGVERDGGRAYQDSLARLAQELGVADRVRFLGFRQDGPELMQAADFLILPSTKEGLPLSILEAQASKVAVIAAPTAGVPEVVADGETGFLVAAADGPGYADRIQRLLAEPDLYHRVTERAYANVRRDHTWSTYCRRVGDLYRDVMEPDRVRQAHARSVEVGP